MSLDQHNYPCPQCHTSRESLEAPCSKCGWTPPPSIVEVRELPTRTNFANLAFYLSVLVVLVAALAVRWFTDDVILTSREIESAPQTPLNAQLSPIESIQLIELSVVNSVPVQPGTLVDIISVEENRILLSKVKVTEVQWEVSGPVQSPQDRASGFVVVSLYELQWMEISDAGDILVRPSK